ncbi:hypothetical protein E1A91_A01G052100v1 [Gossypium mustelinum]|uniref:Uncharacterized protein n=1 Tax=Gossypium mustelinum TaxID=34275 RepID=A0A5D3A9R7_GOSMU|nr:hypothetical protein E1A91_A01G052100v1 [Gossypium mustelinum]
METKPSGPWSFFFCLKTPSTVRFRRRERDLAACFHGAWRSGTG